MKNVWIKILAIIPLALIVIGFWLFSPKPEKQQLKSVNTEKESRFREEVMVLDSLFRGYTNALTKGTPTSKAEAAALYDRQLMLIKQQYTGRSAPAILASKLIRNYEVRLLLHQKKLEKLSLSANEAELLTKRLNELKLINNDLQNQKQMLQQALLTVQE